MNYLLLRGVRSDRGGALRWRRGLLLIVETNAVEERARSWREQTRLREWAAAVESAGFVFLKHIKLRRSHALAFATRALSAAELDAVEARPAPEMRMQRETRELR